MAATMTRERRGTMRVCHVCGRLHDGGGTTVVSANTRLVNGVEYPVGACKGHTNAEVGDAYNRVILGGEPLPKAAHGATGTWVVAMVQGAVGAYEVFASDLNGLMDYPVDAVMIDERAMLGLDAFGMVTEEAEAVGNKRAAWIRMLELAFERETDAARVVYADGQVTTFSIDGACQALQDRLEREAMDEYGWHEKANDAWASRTWDPRGY